MFTGRQELEQALAVHDAEALGAILATAEINSRGARSSAELGERIADALWWHSTTPIGYVSNRQSLEHIVERMSRVLRVSDRLEKSNNVWEQLRRLSVLLMEDLSATGLRFDELPPELQKRINPTWWSTLGLGSSAGSAFVARWGAGRVLALLSSPIGRLLPLIPPLTPYIGAIRTGASAMRVVGGPLGLALSVLALNDALGVDDRKVLPLLLGIGALGPAPVSDAEEVQEGPDLSVVYDADAEEEGEPSPSERGASEEDEAKAGEGSQSTEPNASEEVDAPSAEPNASEEANKEACTKPDVSNREDAPSAEPNLSEEAEVSTEVEEESGGEPNVAEEEELSDEEEEVNAEQEVEMPNGPAIKPLFKSSEHHPQAETEE